MDFADLQRRALAIRQQYAAFEQATYGRSWSTEEIALGFMGDVGDLAKLVLASEGVRQIPDAKTKLSHELSDCLWSLFVLSDRCGIDLQAAFLDTMSQLEAHLAALASNTED